ncbi:acyltransferase [Candidatus Woesearchaeota archaeon]|nr:acyltransferase [Candidatus Woesearchaeota archaeon]
MKIGFLQFNPKFGKVHENNQKIAHFVSQHTADLLVLPELCNTGYMFNDKHELGGVAEKVPEGKTTQTWIKLCKENNLFLVGGLAEQDDSCFYNSSILVGPKGFISKYRKIHLYLNEKKLFTPGNFELQVFRAGDANLGLMICFDFMFPEAARVLALQGSDIICCPMNLVSPPSRVMTVMKARALENGVYVIAVNRVGKERGHCFQGGSEVIGPRMEVLASSTDHEELKIVDIDLEKARDKKYTPLNDLLNDRRTGYYKKILQKNKK